MKYKNEEISEADLYKKLGQLTKNKDEWESSISDVAGLLKSESSKIQAKALWMLGEMGLQYPDKIKEWVPAISDFLKSVDPLFRERALNALGRIGRADFSLIKPYWKDFIFFCKRRGVKRQTKLYLGIRKYRNKHSGYLRRLYGNFCKTSQ